MIGSIAEAWSSGAVLAAGCLVAVAVEAVAWMRRAR